MKKPFDVLDYRIAAIAVSSLFILAGLAEISYKPVVSGLTHTEDIAHD